MTDGKKIQNSLPHQEFQVSINRNPAKRGPEGPDIAKADEIRKQRAALHKKYEQDLASQQIADAQTDDTDSVAPPEPREDVSSIELELPNGMTVIFGPPEGVSMSMRVLRLLGTDAENRIMVQIYRVLMCVREINGVDVPTITNRLDVDKLANRIGDQALDILSSAYRKYWPPLTVGDLPEIKKNLR